MDYSKKFKTYLDGCRVDDFFGKISKTYQISQEIVSRDLTNIDGKIENPIGHKNILLLAGSSRSKNTDACFCDWSKDKIFELKSFDGFQMPGEQKINLASKICKPLAFAENISELFDMMQTSIGKDILLVFNMKGAGATVPKHFHMQVFSDLKNSEVFRLLLPNLEVSDFVGSDEKKEYFDYDLISNQIGKEEFFDIKKLNTPVLGVNFELKTKWVSKLENSMQLRDFVKNAFCNIMQHFFSNVKTEISAVDNDDSSNSNNESGQNFAFNFLFYSGLEADKLGFNIIFRNPLFEKGFGNNLINEDVCKESRWGWLESIGGIRLPEEIISHLEPKTSPEVLEMFYRRQNTK